jgi:hypothetical protein
MVISAKKNPTDKHASDESRRQPGQDCRHRPYRAERNQGAACAEAVAEPAADDLKHQVRVGEGREYEAYLSLIETKFPAEAFRSRADIDPVNVCDQVHEA